MSKAKATVSRQKCRESSEPAARAAHDGVVWHRNTWESPFRSYASVQISDDDGAMTLCLGGVCCSMSIERWHELGLVECGDKP